MGRNTSSAPKSSQPHYLEHRQELLSHFAQPNSFHQPSSSTDCTLINTTSYQFASATVHLRDAPSVFALSAHLRHRQPQHEPRQVKAEETNLTPVVISWLIRRCACKPSLLFQITATMSGSDRTRPGRSGKKWVGLNYQEKEIAKDANGL